MRVGLCRPVLSRTNHELRSRLFSRAENNVIVALYKGDMLDMLTLLLFADVICGPRSAILYVAKKP